MPALKQAQPSRGAPIQRGPDAPDQRAAGSAGNGAAVAERAQTTVDEGLDTYIGSGGTLREGMRGAAVMELQRLIGMEGGGLTGVYGPTTRQTVERLQRERGVQATGAVGATTLRALRASSSANSVLFEHTTTGASSETTKGQGTKSRGAAASAEMAGEDARRLLPYKTNFLAVARKFGLPPALLAAIASRETRGGTQLDEEGYSIWDGDGFGLMQVDRNYHRPRGGPGDVTHIEQAASILADFLNQAKARFPDWSAGRQLQIAVAAYNRGPSAFDHPQDYDAKTTGKDYSSDVWMRARALARDFGGEGLPAQTAPANDQGTTPTKTPDTGASAPTGGPADGATSSTGTAEAGASLEQIRARGEVLREGAEGEAVRELQGRLGMTGGGLTGRFGATTRNYVLEYQERHRLMVDGSVGPETLGVLLGGPQRPAASTGAKEPKGGSSTTGAASDTGKAEPASGETSRAVEGSLDEAIRRGHVFEVGDSGPAVTEIQKLLGMGAGGQSGRYGPTTADQVRAFQAQNNIQANGRVGPDTLKALRQPRSAAPLIDQHRMDHERAGAFCGIATLMMTLQANGKSANPTSRDQLQSFSKGIYTPGAGSSGAAMAERMRDQGLGNAQFTTGGTVSALVAQLAQGKTVPMGVVSVSGKVVEMKRPSARYPGLRVGDYHSHTFGPSGHWVAVVGFKGDVKNPSAFYVNDPDTGARIEMTRKELEASADARSGVWMIGY